jgi:hypothetical protein
MPLTEIQRVLFYYICFNLKQIQLYQTLQSLHLPTLAYIALVALLLSGY